MAEPKENLLMEKIVSLCKRRGFIYQSSEIYGGINGFWDYGPLGAQLKKDLKDGHVRIDSILRNPPEYVETAKVFDILMAVPKFGRVKAARFLNQCRISQSKTVGGLSERQRTELVELFNHRS